MPRCVSVLLNGFSQIFLQRHPLCGLCCLLAIALSAPALAAGALLGGAASSLLAIALRYERDDIDMGLYGYNGVLLGLLLSLQFAWSLQWVMTIVLAAGLSSVALRPLMLGMRQRRWLPAYTLPFVVLGWLLLELGGLHPAPAAGVDVPATIDLLGLSAAIARGVGQIVFLDQPLAGLCILVGLLLADRRAAGWALLGSAAGLGLALLQGWSAGPALLGLHGYAPALAAIALGQTHRPWAPFAGMLLAILLQPGFAGLGLPPLTASFILACWLILASQRLLRHAAADCRPPASKRSPAR